jgi:hypothetical protein
MYYVCIENNNVISVLNYRPNVPSSVTVAEISDEQHGQIEATTHKFDVGTKTVIANPDYSLSAKEQQQKNAVEREFLNSTDWKILRHIRQKALNIATSLSDAEYILLEQQRETAAARIT